MNIYNKLCIIINRINKISVTVAGICVIATSLLVTAEIFLRTLFDTSTLIADEYSSYLLCAMTFLGASYAMSKGAFLSVDIIYDKFNCRIKKIVDVFNILIGIIYMLFVTYFCWNVFEASLTGNIIAVTYSRTPLKYPQSVMVVGCVLVILQLFLELIKSFYNKSNNEIGG